MPDLLSSTPEQKLVHAERRLAWALDELAIMEAAGLADDRDKCERSFSRILMDLNIAFEAIAFASNQLDHGETERWVRCDRESDGLLRYFWHARNVDVHHLLERHITQVSAYLAIVDSGKAGALLAGASDDEERGNRLWAAAMGVSSIEQAYATLGAWELPTPERLDALGLKWVREAAALGLQPFAYTNDRGQVINVASPDNHLGQPIPNSADRAASLAITYYGKALDSVQRAATRQSLI